MPAATQASAKPTVLLAEDSDFFRAQVKRYLEEGGLCVLAAPDGEAAWELLLANTADVRVVITDIEMPRLSGIELSKRIRSDSRTAEIPIVAVTSLAGEDHTQEGRSAGINDYQVKLDREKLLASVLSFVAATSKEKS
jgi:two-component system chemotaxis sensor kinase CheA